MTHEQAHLDALNKIILVQTDLIEYLKKEIARLTAAQIYIGPNLPYTNDLLYRNTPNITINPPPVYPFITGGPGSPAGTVTLSTTETSSTNQGNGLINASYLAPGYIEPFVPVMHNPMSPY